MLREEDPDNNDDEYDDNDPNDGSDENTARESGRPTATLRAVGVEEAPESGCTAAALSYSLANYCEYNGPNTEVRGGAQEQELRLVSGGPAAMPSVDPRVASGDFVATPRVEEGTEVPREWAAQ